MYLQKTLNRKKSSIIIQQVPICLDEDIDKAVKEAAEFEACRIRNVKKAIDARNEADSMVFQTEKAL